MKLSYNGQLLTVPLKVQYQGKSIEIPDVIIDTGSSHTVISPDVLEEIGVRYEEGDPVFEAYGIGGTVPFYVKELDLIQIGDIVLNGVEIDIGILPREHNGLIGLDILRTNNFVIDFENLELFSKD